MNKQNKPLFEADGKNSIPDGIEHEPGGGKALIDPRDAVLLLLDHQSGLFQNVKDTQTHEHSAGCHHYGCVHSAHQLLAGIEASRNRYPDFFGLGCDCFAF